MLEGQNVLACSCSGVWGDLPSYIILFAWYHQRKTKVMVWVGGMELGFILSLVPVFMEGGP